VTDGVPGGAATIEQNSAFDSLRHDPRFQELVAAARQPRPPSHAARPISAAEVAEGVATVSAANTGWDPRFDVLRGLFHCGR
jgi:hypothetical protein